VGGKGAAAQQHQAVELICLEGARGQDPSVEPAAGQQAAGCIKGSVLQQQRAALRT
jgi:hypothetical protein